jgi:hypothetical protein
LAIVLAKVGDRFVIGSKPAGQPHHFKVTLALALKAPTRLHTIEIAMDARVIARPPEVERLHCLDAQPIQVELVDKRINDANRIVVGNPVVEASRQQ